MSADNWAICPRCRERAGIYGSEAERTFREDYEFYGAEEGKVTASYSGGCTVCGLSAEINHSMTFFDPSVPAAVSGGSTP